MAQVTTVKDIRELMMALFDKLPDEPVESDLIDVEAEIRAIASRAEQSKLFKRSQDKFDEFVSNLEKDTPLNDRLVTSWIWLLTKINNAPTSFHMNAAVILCIPLVARYLPAKQ